MQEFQFQTFVVLSPTILEQVSPPPAGAIAYNIMSYSGSGNVTAPVPALSALADATAGCEASDFAGFPVGSIALISRGTCPFALKATNASAAGAVGVVIYNNGPGPINGTLGNDFALNLPVTSVTQAVGLQLASTTGLVMRLKTETLRGVATTSNVLAETRAGSANNVIMVGAHLDLVNAGPGIQDNGSGSGAILEVALQMAKVQPRNKVRFAWWGAEEANLVGSNYYVANLSEALAKFDRSRPITSSSSTMATIPTKWERALGPEGSAQIEALFEIFYDGRGAPYKGTYFDGPSDYGPFIAAGIPAGGLFTGAEGIKTPEEVALWGGTAGEQYDPCYHQKSAMTTTTSTWVPTTPMPTQSPTPPCNTR